MHDVNARQSIEETILRSMRASPSASVFSSRHFGRFGSSEGLRKALSRLVRAGKVRRIRRGLYDLPREDPTFGPAAPDIEATVRSLMEGSRAQWQFTGAYAANALGLSEQVPAKIVILTDGVGRRVALGKLMLEFRRAAPRNLIGAGTRAGLVIQALRHLKGSPDMARHVARLRKGLDDATRRDLTSFLPSLVAWMRPLVERITRP